MYKTAVLAIDLSPAAEPLLECAAEFSRWGVGGLVITHVVRVGWGQAPGDRALQEIKEWLEGRDSEAGGLAIHSGQTGGGPLPGRLTHSAVR